MEHPNIEYIIKLSADNETVKENLINVLKTELPGEIEAYYENIRAKKMEQAALSVHKLKHKIAILGLEESYLLAEHYENQLKENQKKSQIAFEKTLDLMQNFVNCL